MKTLIITQIANNFRKKLPIARNLKIQHINYMYEYNYIKLFKSLVNSYKLEPKNSQHEYNAFGDRFIK